MGATAEAMESRYVFHVTVRLSASGRVFFDPDTFETRLYRPADPPGEPGWLFFRDNLWRGELSDPDHFRRLADRAIAAEVLEVDYRAFETDEASLAALKDEIRANLDDFRSETVPETVTKYFGSSIEVRADSEGGES